MRCKYIVVGRILFYEIGYSTSEGSISILRTFDKFKAILIILTYTPDSKVHGGPSGADRTQVGPMLPGLMDFAIWDI